MANELSVNNGLYDDLGERWYTAKDDPVALLRAESRCRNPWMMAKLREKLGDRPLSILDIGCGGGFVSNALASAGHKVEGVDLSEESLAIARHYDRTKSVHYQKMDAMKLDFPEKSFDAISVMDFLEHVEEPGKVIAAAARVLKPGGLFFFSTFNRNPISHLVIIKGVEWFVRNTPDHLHISRLFVKPSEARSYCASAGMTMLEMHGLRPKFFTRAMRHLILHGEVREDFAFTMGRSLMTGYIGMAQATASS